MGMRFRGRGGCGEGPGFPEGLFAMGIGRGWGRHWGHGWDQDWGGGGGWGRRGRRGGGGRGGLRPLSFSRHPDPRPRHGYDLIRAIEELTHGAYAPSPGVVYPTLTMLQDMGLIEEAKGDSARKVFQVTGEGKDHLLEKAEEIEDLLGRLEAVGGD